MTVRDPDSQRSRGFAFVNFDTFEAGDAGILDRLLTCCSQFPLDALVSRASYRANERTVRAGSRHQRHLRAEEGLEDGATRFDGRAHPGCE